MLRERRVGAGAPSGMPTGGFSIVADERGVFVRLHNLMMMMEVTGVLTFHIGLVVGFRRKEVSISVGPTDHQAQSTISFE